MEKIPVKPNTLVQMLEMQKKLLNHYITLEGLPLYPVDLTEKDNQKLLKDFLGRFLEELGEAFEQMILAYEAVNVNKPQIAFGHLEEYNVEIADAWHFFLEILIYFGIGEYELESFVNEYIDEHPQYGGFHKPGQPFKFFLLVADYENQANNRKVVQNRADRFTIATEQDWVENFLVAGGRKISADLLDTHGYLLWNITYACMMLRNVLNNRDWNQTMRVLNGQKARTKLIELMMAWALYMDFIGIGEIQIVNCYAFKHKENLRRIEENY